MSEPPRSGGSGAHVNDDLREDLAGGEQILNAGVLVGTVHVAVEAGHAAAEGHAAGDIMDVGAAADGQALARAPGIRLITAQQRLHEGRIGVGMVRGVHAALHGEAEFGKGGLRGQLAVLFRGAQGEAAVKTAGEAVLVDLQQGEGQRQRAGDGVGLGDAQSAARAVPVGEERVQGMERGGAAHLGQRQGAQQMQQRGDGVVALLRQGGVGAFAVAEDAQVIPRFAQLIDRSRLGGGAVAIGTGGRGGEAGDHTFRLGRQHVDAKAPLPFSMLITGNSASGEKV